MSAVMQKISVITICYNAVKVIEKTMRSVLNQSYLNLEYVIVDGGSKDGTQDVIRKIAGEYPNRDIIIISEPDKGIYDAMNKGIKASSGEWLNMMNAGDCFANNDVFKDIFANEIPMNKTVLFSGYYTRNKNGEKIFRDMDMINRPCFNHQSVIYRKKLHSEHGYYAVTPQIIISDIIFFYQIPKDELLKVNTPIAFFDDNGISSQGKWSLQQWLCADVVFRKRTFSNMLKTYLYRTVRESIPFSLRSNMRRLFK